MKIFQQKVFPESLKEQLFYKIWPLFNARKIKPIIYKTMNINEAEKAHQIMSKNNNIGKIVLEIS